MVQEVASNKVLFNPDLVQTHLSSMRRGAARSDVSAGEQLMHFSSPSPLIEMLSSVHTWIGQ